MLLAPGGVGLLLLLGTNTLRGGPERVYFPGLVFHREAERNQFLVDRYSKHLRAMREPSLRELAQHELSLSFRRLARRSGLSAVLELEAVDAGLQLRSDGAPSGLGARGGDEIDFPLAG